MRYVFGEYVLDTQLLELRRDGTLVQLERRVLNALMFLVQHRDRVVMRQELLEHLWPDRYVSNASLEQCIAAGRRAMGDSGRSQHIIQTLHGRGYRFIAAADVQAPTHQEAVQEASARCPESDLKPEATHHDPLSPAYRVPEGEYKPVTILCGALAQPTALAKQLGLEALHDLAQAFFTQVEEVVHHYSGIVRPSGEDGFLAQFGIPIAQEDHAWRALLAADALQQRLRAFRAEMDDPQKTALTVRLGVHTGRAVVGRGGEAQQVPTLVAGETTTIAMRLQYLAEPDTLLISETTLALVQDQVHSEAFELVRGTGPSESVMAYKVLAMHRQATAENPRWENGLSPFVGRQWELAGLHALLTRVQEGQGQVVGILGEPGIGKSRLLREFHQSIDETRSTYLTGHCLSYGEAIPYAAVTDLLWRFCGMTQDDPPAVVTAKVGQMLQQVGMDPEADAPYLLRLLGRQDSSEQLAKLTPQALKDRTFTTLRNLMLYRSQQQPLILAIENLHWIDATSEAYLMFMLEHLIAAPILLLVTHRPGYQPPWIGKSYVTQIALSPLALQDSLAVIRAVLSPERGSPPLLHAILQKAEGNPFFLEELAHAVVEHGDAPDDITVPDTIQGVLTARMDRLPEATKQVLQMAAVLGREIPIQLLQALWQGPGELAPALLALQRLEFLYRRYNGAEELYVFKHALTQEVAYESLLPIQRRVLHTAAGRALERLYAERLEAVYDPLAYHYARTDEAAKAVAYLTHVAEKAARGHAHAEAVQTLQEALNHAERLPVAERDQRYVELLLHQVQSLYCQGQMRQRLNLLLQAQERLERLQDPTLAGPYYRRLAAT